MAWSQAKLTIKGRELLAEVTASKRLLEITEVWIGDGTLSNIESATELRSKRIKAEIAGIKDEGQVCKIKFRVSNKDTTTAITMREIGFYAKGKDGRNLLFSAMTDNEPVILPVKGNNGEFRQSFVVAFGYSSATNVLVNPTIYEGQTLQEVNVLIDNHNMDPNAHEKIVQRLENNLKKHREKEVLDHPDGSVTTEKLKNKAVSNEKLADYSITNIKLTTGCVDDIKLASNAVTAEKVKDKNITTDKLADYSITNIKLTTGCVDAIKLGDNAVITSKIANKNVTADKLADKSITIAKLANDTIQRIDQKVNRSGDTMTGKLTVPELHVGAKNVVLEGSVNFKKGATNLTGIHFLPGNQDGHGIGIGMGGTTIVGAGESVTTVAGALPDKTSEGCYIASDYEIKVLTNLQSGWGSRKEISIDLSGDIKTPGHFYGGGNRRVLYADEFTWKQAFSGQYETSGGTVCTFPSGWRECYVLYNWSRDTWNRYDVLTLPNVNNNVTSVSGEISLKTVGNTLVFQDRGSAQDAIIYKVYYR